MLRASVCLVALIVPLSFGIAIARGDELPPEIKAGEHRLQLNGAGSRTKTLLQLYVAGLYLVQPSRDAQQIVTKNEPMAIRIKITSGFVSQEKLVESLAEGFDKATGGRTDTIREPIAKFRACFQDEITKGDTFDIVYVPEHGVIVNKNGKLKGVVPGLAFKQALFAIWLSDNPTDKNLRQALLTQPKLR